MEEAQEKEFPLNLKDLTIKTCRGSGAGGQHKNVTDSAVQITHKPSGIRVRCEDERSQHLNKAMALNVLRSRLKVARQQESKSAENCSRREQVGSGMRGDKVRTIAVQRGTVTDHISDKKVSLKAFLRGELDLLCD